MVVVIPKKRRDGKSSFLKLVSYLSLREEKVGNIPVHSDAFFERPSTSKAATFDRLIDYIDRHASPESQQLITHLPDGSHRILCEDVLCETNTLSVATAAVEMEAVALKNTRCKDPVYHFFLSWPETDSPTVEQIFESARHSLDALGMSEHQYSLTK